MAAGLLAALAACGPRAWADRVIALDEGAALVVTADAELGVVGPGARWRSTLDLRGHDVVPESLGWNGTAALATAEGTVLWNPSDGAWQEACCGGAHARMAPATGRFLGWEEGRDGTVAIAPGAPAWRHPAGRTGRHVVGSVAVLGSDDHVVVVRLADGTEIARVPGAVRCVAGERALVAGPSGIAAVDEAGAVTPLGSGAAPGGCLVRGDRLLLLDGAEAGPPVRLVDVADGRTLEIGPYAAGAISGDDAPRYVAVLRTAASEAHWVAVDLDGWRVVDGPSTRHDPARIDLARAGSVSVGWCGEDVVALDGANGTWHLGTVPGWAADAGAIAGGVAWTRTYDRVALPSLAALSWGAGVRIRGPGDEPFPGCLGLSAR